MIWRAGTRVASFNQSGTGTTTYAYDDADRLTEVDPPAASPVVYTWDDNGNLTDRGSDAFYWDYEDRMVEATVNSVTTNFVYRGDGLRDSRAVSGGATTTFTWDIASGLPVVLDDGNQYVYGAGLTSMKQGGNWYYYLADGLGSTMAVVDSAGNSQKSYTYDVYGEATPSGGLANEFDFAGQQTDGTGLQYLRARYYDPETGTFLSRDPLASKPGWSGSGFAYSSGNPVLFSDPSGLCDDGSPVCSGVDETCGKTVWCMVPGSTSFDFGAVNWFEYREAASGREWEYRVCWLVGEYGKTLSCDAGFTEGDAVYALLSEVGWGVIDWGMTVAGLRPKITINHEHGGRPSHAGLEGVSEAAIDQAIRRHIRSSLKNADDYGNFWGNVRIAGRTVQFRAYRLADGTINVGTYYVVP